MKHLIINNYRVVVLVCVLTFYNTLFIRAFTQEINSVGTVTETVSPLISLNPETNKLVLGEDEEINSFLNKLENSDNKALNFSVNTNETNDIFFNKDNVSEGINIFNDNNSNKLLDELSNNKVIFDSENDNSLNPDKGLFNANDNKSKSLSDNISINIPIVNATTLENVKISSIGLDEIEMLPNFIDLWKTITFKRAIYFLDNINYEFDSIVLKNLLKEVLSISQDPPIGSIGLEKEFINKKLTLIANLKDLEKLNKLIDLLPSDQDFDYWRALRVKHSFLKGEFESDSLACKIVNEVSLNNEDEFWKKAQIFCQIIQGNEDDALFDAELLKASGIKDENFFNLFYSMIGDSANYAVDEENLNLLHISMMEQIRNLIPNEFIFKTEKYNYPVLLNIENIQPETKSLIVDELLENNIISNKETEYFYSIIGDKSLNLQEALDNLKINLGPQSRADIWTTIHNNLVNQELNRFILELIRHEAANGRSTQSIALYAGLLITPNDITNEYYSVIRKIKLINDIYHGKELLGKYDDDELFISNLLLFSPDQEISVENLIKYNLEDIIPILNQFNLNIIETDYLDLYLTNKQKSLVKESDILLKLALENATQEKLFIEALTIQLLMLKDVDLNQIPANTIYDITKSLIYFDLNSIAKNFMQEWLISKLVTNISNIKF